MPSSSRVNRAFVGIPSFLRAPICTDPAQLDADIAILGAPTDEGSPFMPGSRFGPRSIREHSLRFGVGGKGVYETRSGRHLLGFEIANSRIVDVGDADVLPTNVVDTFRNITEATRHVLDRGAMPVVIGGDHAITYPVVRAFTGPIHVIHFDAHMDYAPFIHGLEMTNGHAFRHISRMDHVQSLTQIGIRGLRNSSLMVDDSLGDGNRVVTMDEFLRTPGDALVQVLPKRAKCYVSIDIDVLDMSLVPGCVSAEPEGMSYGQLRDTLVAIAEHVQVVGFDLVEVNPQLDVGTGITSYLAAHLIIEFLGNVCEQPTWTDRRNTRAAAVASQSIVV